MKINMREVKNMLPDERMEFVKKCCSENEDVTKSISRHKSIV